MAIIGDTFRALVQTLTGQRPGALAPTSTWAPLTDQELLDAYRGSWMAAKIVDAPAEDMTREWRAWQASDPQIEAIEEEEKRLGLRAHVQDGLTMGRLMGGAVIIAATADAGDLATELNPDSIGKGGISYLLTLDRTQLQPGEMQLDPRLPGFNLPRDYTINTTGTSAAGATVHPSRLVRFVGRKIPQHLDPGLRGWGDSVLQAVGEAMNAARLTFASVAAMVEEAKIDVVQVDGLMAQVSTQEYRDRLTAKYQLAAQLKQLAGVLLLDSKENWQTKQLRFSDLPDVMDRMMQVVCGAADMPATRFLSQSPKGLNATGESDLVNYENALASKQQSQLGPALYPLDELLIRSALGSRPPEIHYEWNPLRQETPAEAAERAKKRAETTQIYVTTGLISHMALAKAVQNQLVEDGVYPGLEAALAEAKAAGEVAPYEEPPEPVVVAPGGQAPPTGTTPPGRRAPQQAQRRAANDASLATLYVSRPVENAAQIMAWARGQGFKTMVRPEDLHVTLAYSRTPVDWTKMPEPAADTITVQDKEAYRWVMQLGDKGATVLMFQDEGLRARWQAFVDAGASWDFESFMPHVTVSYQASYLDHWMLEAYQGPIVLGPEVWTLVEAGAGGGDLEVSTDPESIR